MRDDVESEVVIDLVCEEGGREKFARSKSRLANASAWRQAWTTEHTRIIAAGPNIDNPLPTPTTPTPTSISDLYDYALALTLFYTP